VHDATSNKYCPYMDGLKSDLKGLVLTCKFASSNGSVTFKRLRKFFLCALRFRDQGTLMALVGTYPNNLIYWV
jgi:hypothetical protein